jgi:phospho-N-acetylmuramoyl-pentapeptide-transferase
MFYHWIYPLHEHISFLNIFRYITVRAAFAAITAFFVTLLMGNFVINKLKEMKVGQVVREDGPKKHLAKQGTPTMGGVMMLFAFLISMAFFGRFDNEYVYMAVFSAVWFGAIGFIDDLLKLKIGTRGLPPKGKLILQFVGACAIMAVYLFLEKDKPYRTELTIPFVKTFLSLPVWVYFAIGVLMITGWSNAVNITDGLDGLASGLCLLVFGALIVMAYIVGNIKMSAYLLLAYVPKAGELAVVSAAFGGSLLGFLWFNSYPAQVFMGDVGALMLGGVIATVAVVIKQEILLLVVGFVFVVEIASVILQVASFKLTKKRIFRMAPLHHHFQLKGMSEPKIIVRFWIVAVIVLLFTLSTLKLR